MSAFLHRAAALALALALVDPGVALAGTCTPGLPVQTLNPPVLQGQLAFEGTMYSQRWQLSNPHVLYYDFANPNAGVQSIDKGMVGSWNPNFSPDGKWIVFYGNPTSSCASDTIYAYNVKLKIISPLLPCNVNSYEDIRFFPDQQMVVFKALTSKTSRNIVYAPITLNTATGVATLGPICNVTNDSAYQHSQPSVSGTGKYIYYSNSSQQGVATGLSRSPFVPTIPCASAMSQTPIGSQSNSAYYPVARDQTLVVYTRHSANATVNNPINDQIFSIAPDTDAPTIEDQLKLNDCNQNTNDAALVDENYIIFSQGGANEQLFIGNIGQALIWKLTAVNVSAANLPATDLRGASYSANR